MIELVMKFVSWIKDAIGFVIGLPGMFGNILATFNGMLSWLPYNLGSILMGAIATVIMIAVVIFVVKLVVSLI